jgi:hypothetical protein
MSLTRNSPAATTDVIDAMRSLQSESDRWHLAESLAVLIPSGLKGFADLKDQATAAGVGAKLSTTTLRLYRDTANRWPADKRVPNVSFSAHREAMVLPIDQAVAVLEKLAANLGPAGVSVTEVRRAVAAAQGKALPASRTRTATAGASPAFDVLADLESGAAKLIAAIDPAMDPARLDNIQAGLNKALVHVETLRTKKARKVAAPKVPAAPAPAPAPAPTASPVPVAATGDLRDL